MLSVEIDGVNHKLGDPISCSRSINTETNKSSQAFGLPRFEVKPVKMDSFIGDVDKGGSCNVHHLNFTPHNLTHIETPAHITKKGLTLLDLPITTFSGLATVIDLSSIEFPDGYIYPNHIKQVDKFPEATILAIKTKASKTDEHTNFTGTDPISLHPSTTQYLTEHHNQIRLLILDLPSADKEDDGGLLLSHKNFFNLGSSPTGEAKAIVELSYLRQLHGDQYYYCVLTPPKVDIDAIITDILFFNVV